MSISDGWAVDAEEGEAIVHGVDLAFAAYNLATFQYSVFQHYTRAYANSWNDANFCRLQLHSFMSYNLCASLHWPSVSLEVLRPLWPLMDTRFRWGGRCNATCTILFYSNLSFTQTSSMEYITSIRITTETYICTSVGIFTMTAHRSVSHANTQTCTRRSFSRQC